MGFRVVCINDSKRPAEVPESSWIKKGEIYTVTEVLNMARQRMTIAFKLAEVSMPEGCKYDSYLATRFAYLSEEDEKAAEKAVEELIEESFKELV